MLVHLKQQHVLFSNFNLVIFYDIGTQSGNKM